MKWVVFFILLAAAFPLSNWLRSRPNRLRLAAVALGFSPFLVVAVPVLDIAVIDWAGWPGFARGALFSVVETLALAVILACPRRPGPIPFSKTMTLYIFAVLVSVANAQLFMPAFFYVWQIVRLAILYIAVLRLAHDKKNVEAVFLGLGFGVLTQCVIVLYQKFGLAMSEPNGSFGHRNQLGLVVNMVTVPVFAFFLSRNSKLFGLNTLSGIAIAVLTTSRAAIGLAGLGIGLVYLKSISARFTLRKMATGTAIALLLAALAPVVFSTYESRFSQLGTGASYDGERTAFIEAAYLISIDHPLGIGPNNFVPVANTGGYYDRAGVIAVSTSRSTMVHNIYWLALAETGYLGLLALLFVFFQLLKEAIKLVVRYRKSEESILIFGLGVSFLLVAVHSYFEWVLFSFYVQAVFIILIALFGNIADQLKASRGT